jgi:uncharacterized cupredoxin-like copper-binding protein
MTRGRVADGIAILAFSLIFVAGLAVIAVDPAAASADRVEIRIRYSHFDPSTLAVAHGRPVTFVLINDDPIDHEWLIGDEQMHRVHRTGTEAHHGSRSTEVSIPALSTVETTVTFDDRVSWRYICHLPGHEAYGMVGLLTAE